MMRIGLAAALAAAMIASPGCSDPSVDLLPADRPATLHSDDGKSVGINVKGEGPGSVGGLRVVEVASGTRVVVLADEPAKPPVQPYLRMVRVRVAEGEHEGVEGGIGRWHLRPAR